MSFRESYPDGVPCWVDTMQPDSRAATDFYGPLLGWEFDEPGAMPDGGEYFVARLDGRDVAGIGSAPDLGGGPMASWNTYVSVASVEATVEQARAAGATVLVDAADASPAGRLAVFADPTGAVICAWEAGVRLGAQVVNDPGAWAMSSLHTPDPDSSGAFYGAVFGWRSEPMEGAPLSLWRLEGYVGGEEGQPVPRDVVAVLSPIPEGSEIPPHWNVNIRVEDVDATVARAGELGGSVLMDPEDAAGFRSAAIADPQGAVFAISQLLAS